MTVLVYIIGAALVLAGAVFISMGVPIVRLEIGWSEVIGGSVAASAGFVVLAIGVLVTKFDELRRAILGLNMAAAMRETFAEPQPDWDEQPERVLTPHPLAPTLQARSPDFDPQPVVYAAPPEEPHVEPEPSLEAAPLHPEEPVIEAQPFRPGFDPSHEPEIIEGAPALQAEEDLAPPLPPVEAVPPESLTEPAEPALPQPPSRSPEPRPRPNFLAAFLARRSAGTSIAERPSPVRERPSVEPTLVPLKDLDEGETPLRTPVDLSSGWGEPEPAHHGPGGLADDALSPPPEEHAPVGEAEFETEERGSAQPEPEVVTAIPPLEAGPGPSHNPAEVPAPAAPPMPDVLKPVVVGRYNAGSASYIMYSNGMIEVETESGTHQFASMQELKAFIERRDAAQV